MSLTDAFNIEADASIIGTHPELHHLQDELTKRRDKRLMLAERKREYEIGALERKRKEENVNVWDHWEVGIGILRRRLVSVPCFLDTVHFCNLFRADG